MYYAIFALVMVTPAALFAVGIWWKVSPPKRNGSGLAYRTALSDRSDETWAFTHKHIARLWTRIGVIEAVLSAALMVFLREHCMSFFLWLIVGQVALMCVSVFLVDMLLKNAFDEDGKPLQ